MVLRAAPASFATTVAADTDLTAARSGYRAKEAPILLVFPESRSDIPDPVPFEIGECT
jgi:hypothetical protein